ncbi:hypothetical protein D3C81_1953470 [compost metagenome]
MQVTDKAAHQWVVITLLGRVRKPAHRFELNDQHLVVTVGHYAQWLGAGGALAQAHIAYMERKGLVVGQARKVRPYIEGVTDQVGNRAAQQFPGRQAEPALGVLAGLEDAQVGFVQH